MVAAHNVSDTALIEACGIGLVAAAVTAAGEAQRPAACNDAITLPREIAEPERDDDGDVILGTDANGRTISCRTSPSSLPSTTS